VKKHEIDTPALILDLDRVEDLADRSCARLRR